MFDILYILYTVHVYMYSFQSLLLNVTNAHKTAQSFTAYRRCYSTETALAKVYSDLVQAMDAGNQAALALLDMTAAFDAVDHGILLERMRRSYGVSGPALAWFTSYLCGRSASVRLQNLQSSSYSSPHGVP